MRFDNPYSRDLGTYTWAELQAAYPNGGGALAALPTGVRAFVSDWNANFTPSADKTYWRNIGRILLSSASASVTVNTGTTEQTLFSYAVPAKLIGPVSGLAWRVGMRAGTNGGPMSVKFKFDSTAIDTNGIASAAALSGVSEIRNLGAVNSNAYAFQNGTYVSTLTTLDLSAAWTFAITATPANSGDSITLRFGYLELV